MSKKDNGGPAFPQHPFTDARGYTVFPFEGYGMGGMSRRDFFAIEILKGIMSNPSETARRDFTSSAVVAEAVRFADALLEALK